MPQRCASGKLKGNALKLEDVKLSHGTRIYITVEPCQPDCALIFLELRNFETDATLKLQFDDCIKFSEFPHGYISARDYLNFLEFWKTLPPTHEHVAFMWRALSSIVAREAVLMVSSSPVAHTADDELILFSLDVEPFETEVKVDPKKVRGFIEVTSESFEENAEETASFEAYVRKSDRD